MVKKGKVENVSIEFVQKLAAVLGAQPEEVFPDYGSSRQQARENVGACRAGQETALKEAESRKKSIEGMNGGQQPEDKFNVKTQPNNISDLCVKRHITAEPDIRL